MKNKDLHRIFEQTDCLGRQDMLTYLEGDFSVNEQYQFEKHLNSCSICRDEFDGLLAMKDHKKLPAIVIELNQKVDDYVHYSLKKPFLKRYNTVRIAALALILISSGFFINYYLQYSSKEYYDAEMVSQSIEETANDEVDMLLTDSFAQPASEERIPPVEKKIESAKDNNRTDFAIENNIQTSGEKADKINVLSDIVDDEMADIESDEEVLVGTSKDKTKIVDEPNLRIESRGEGVSDEKQFVSKELAAVENEMKKEEKIVYDEISGVNERKLDNVSRGKLRANKKSKSKGYATSYQQTGIDAYNDGNYQAATVALNNSVKYEGKEDKTIFYLGQSYSAQGDSKKALLNLNKLLKNKESQYKNDAMWEKAQLLIRMGKRKSAINVLNDLVKENSPFKIEAQHKLDSLLLTN